MESINLTSGYRIIFHYQWGNWFHGKTQTPKSAGARVPTLVLFIQGPYPRTCADLISCGSKSPGKRHMLYPSQLVKSLCAQIVDTEGPTVSLLFFFLICLSVDTYSSNLQDPKGNHMFKWNGIQYP